MPKSGSPVRAARPDAATVIPAARSSRAMARPIGPVPTISAVAARDPLGFAVLPRAALLQAQRARQILREREDLAEHVLGDRAVEHAP